MNSAGNVRWRTRLPRPVIALEFDPLGRYLIHGHATGEIVRLDLFGGGQGRSSKSTARRRTARRRRRRQTRCGPPQDRCAHPTGWFPRSRPTSSRRRPSSPSSMSPR